MQCNKEAPIHKFYLPGRVGPSIRVLIRPSPLGVFLLPSELITAFHIKMTNHVFQCNKYQERIKDIKSGKIMISSNIKDFIIILFVKL